MCWRSGSWTSRSNDDRSIESIGKPQLKVYIHENSIHHCQGEAHPPSHITSAPTSFRRLELLPRQDILHSRSLLQPLPPCCERRRFSLKIPVRNQYCLIEVLPWHEREVCVRYIFAEQIWCTMLLKVSIDDKRYTLDFLGKALRGGGQFLCRTNQRAIPYGR